MTNPTQPQETFTIRIDKARKTFKKDASRLAWAVVVIDLLFVTYTLPHNLHAFGVAFSAEFTLAMAFSILGVLVIEATSLYSAYHFTHGLLISTTQTNETQEKWYTSQTFWAGLTLAITVVIITGNAIESQLLYMLEDGLITPENSIGILVYQAFILPATIPVCFILVTLLTLFHPDTQRKISEYRFMIDTQKAEQAAEIEEQKALQSISLARIDAKREYAHAEANQISIKSAQEIAELQTEAEIENKRRELSTMQQLSELDTAIKALQTAKAEADQKQQFDEEVSKQTAEAMQTKVNDILNSDDLQEVIHTKASQKIAKALDIAPNSKLGKKLAGN